MTATVRTALGPRWARVTAGAVVAYSLLYWVPGSPLPERLPWGVVAQGVIFGSSYSLLAMGLILVYRSSRIVNFAYGAMGALPGAITLGLYLGQSWNYWVSLVIGVAAGVGTGALVEVIVIRRFTNSSRLVLTVASLGLAQILGAFALGITLLLGADLLIGDIHTPISASIFIRPYPVRGDHLLLLAVTPATLIGLGWFLLRTETGTAVRAAAENRDRAALLGIPVRRVQTIVWAIAGGLAALTFITRAPFTGVTPEAFSGGTAILPGLAVAVLARFKSLPVALGAGIGLGIVEWTIRWNVTADSVFNVTFLVIILAGLLLQKDHTSRADAAEGAWDASGTLKPLPAHLRHHPAVRRSAIVVGVVIAAAAVIVPLRAAPSTVSLMSLAVVWALVAVSLVVLTGWGGNVSLGQFAIVGVGAMTAGQLMARWNIDFFAAAIAAMAVGGIVAVLIGLPALRIRGFYLAVTTLAFAVALDSYFLNPINFPALVPDSVPRPVLWKRFDMRSEWVTFYVCLAALVVAVAVVRAVRRSRIGRAMLCARDNERFAAALAMPTTAVKLQTFILSGALAGLAGALYVTVLTAAGQGTFRPVMSLEVFSFAVIGGLTTAAGAIAGVIAFRALDFILAENFSGDVATILRLTLSGGGLVLILYLLPGGLWQYVQRQRDRYVDRIVGRAATTAEPDTDTDTDTDTDAPADETDLIGGALGAAEPVAASR